ncbi:MAG: hypothetical protein ACXAEU_06250 [Candidatus Hodarchaeales archaeon]|jgi:hypothetical protein
MDEKQISELIGREVAKALKREVSRSSPEPFRVLAIMVHPGRGLDHLCEALVRMAREQVPALVWTVQEVDDIIHVSSLSTSLPTMKVLLREKNNFRLPDFTNLEMIIFGSFSFELADNLINLKDGNIFVNVLIQGLLAKVPVHILTPFPLSDLSDEYKPSSRLNRELRQRLAQLAEMGFGLMDENDLKDRFLKQAPESPDLITEDYLETMRGKTNELRLSRSAIITPLAHEKARDLEIRIVRI